MNYLRLILLTLICTFSFTDSSALPGDTIVSLITCAPGHEVYELEGHSALRIRTPHEDIAVSYGVFDFNAPNFIYRFVKGETDYMAAAIPWQYFIYEYRCDNRRVDEQVLDLTPEQTRRLLDRVKNNLRPENRVYRYNYVKDNCAIRPLAAIESGLGDTLQLAHSGFEPLNGSVVTFRNVMRYYHRNYPWYQFGIDLALGSGIDYPISNREQAFAPVLLERQISTATYMGKPVVSKSEVVVGDERSDPRLDPTPFLLSPNFVCWLVFILLALVTVYDFRHRRVTKWVDALYFGIMGVAGLLLTFLIFVSVHEATSPNYLYFWLNPFCLIPTIFIWLKNGKNVVLSYQIINFAVVLILSVAWYWLPQSANPAFLPLVLGDLLRAASYIRLNLPKK